MLISQIVLYAAAAGVIALVIKTLMRWYYLPRGPWGLPYFGYLFFLPDLGKIPKMLTEMSKRYGDIFYLNFGMNDMVILNSNEAITDLFRMPECQNGTNTFTLKMERETGSSRLFALSGQMWAFNRKIANRAIGMLQTTKNSRLEVNAQKGSEWLLAKWKGKVGVPFKDRDDLKSVTCAVQGSLVFGGLPNADNQFVKILTSYQAKDDFNGILNSFLEFFPSLSFLYNSRIQKQREILKEVAASIKLEFERVRNDTSGGLRMMDTLEKVIRDTPQKDKDALGLVDNDIRFMLMDLYDGGCFSLADKLEWTMLYMATWPETCAPMWEELDAAIPDDRMPEVADLDSCPYTRAFLSESMRYSASTATALTHTTSTDIWYKGYFFPKGTGLWANIMAAQFDPKLWPDPKRFNPYRFIDESGSYNMEQQEKLLAFGYGKRRCPGEVVAYPIMFIYLATIAKNFEVHFDPNNTGDPKEDTECVFLLLPGPHKVILKARYKT